MRAVQGWLFIETARLNGVSALRTSTETGAANGTNTMVNVAATFWDMDIVSARHRLNPGRLREQMFAYTVTNQVMDTLSEVGLPFVLRFVQHMRERYFSSKPSYSKLGVTKGSGTRTSSSASTTSRASTDIGTHRRTPSTSDTSPLKKRVVFEDEQEKGGMAERLFLDRVREEAELPEYELFDDYSEMITQFGYVALWSAIWPLAGGGCLLVPVSSLFPSPLYPSICSLPPRDPNLKSRLMTFKLFVIIQ